MTSALHYVFVSAHMPPMRGGLSDYTARVAAALSERGLRVSVVTSSGAAANPSGGSSVLPRIRRWSLGSLPELLRLLASARPDVVSLQYVPYMYHAYGMPFFLVPLACMLRVKGIPLVTTFHEVATAFAWRQPKYWGVALAQRIIASLLAFFSTDVMVSTTRYARMLGPRGRRSVRVAVGSNVAGPTPLPESIARTRATYARVDDILLATVAAEDGRRRLDLVLPAMLACAQRLGKNMRMLVLGNATPDDAFLHRRLRAVAASFGMENDVIITGHLPRQAFREALRAADMCVLLDDNLHGGIGLRSGALAAACEAGLPVISNRGPLTDELFQHGKNIFFINALTVEGAASSLWALLTDVPLRNRLRQGSRALYDEQMSWDVITRAYEDIARTIRRQHSHG